MEQDDIISELASIVYGLFQNPNLARRSQHVILVDIE
jgi:hypothetical protein